MRIKHLFLLFFLLFAFDTFAQELQPVDSTKWLCTYNYEFLQDSTNRSSLKKDQMFLQIGSHLSKYTCFDYYVRDSTRYFNPEKMRDPSQVIVLPVSHSNPLSLYTVYKNYPAKGLMFFTAFADTKFYKVEQPMRFDWSLDMKKDTVILGYSCQRAFTTYAGRNWIAWYAPQIPIFDGPYKFNGLPGLIVKISDSANMHSMTLNSIKKINHNQLITMRTGSFEDVTAEDYHKIMKNYRLRLYEMIKSALLVQSPGEEQKAKVLNGMKSTNNFIEKF